MITPKEARELVQLGSTLNSISDGIEESAKHGKREHRINAPIPDSCLRYLIALGYEVHKNNSYYIIKW